MTKVHPSGSAAAPSGDAPAALTVWRKSLLLNFKGFVAFDSNGDVVFRVDDYGARGGSSILLMNAAGEPLLTARRKMLSWGERWTVYEGEGRGEAKLTVRRKGGGGGGLLFWGQGKVLATANGAAGGLAVEGSYARRSCEVFDDRRRRVAEICRKESTGGVLLGADVFSLIVQPGLDAAIAMALVLLLDQMFGSSS
ncbi:protein LURP-one-related 8-like [Wolffia australiana]